MLSRRYETIVGIFVLASLAALLIMVLVIAQQEGLWQEKMEYHAIFKNVAGLKKGDEVRLAGVTVGNVNEISINPEGNIVVSFNVGKKFSDRIRQDSQATIGFKSLLGEKSLDISTGSPTQPPILPDGLIASVEPLDVTQLVAKVGPSLESLQVILTNLASMTESLRNPESDLNKTLDQLKRVVDKIEQGKGSLGLLVNDTALYQETVKTVASARSFTKGLEEGKGLFGAMLNNPHLRDQAQKTLVDMGSTFANLSQATENFKKAADRLPGLTQEAESFMDHLNRAGKGLPGLVTSGEGLMSDADKVAKAAQQSWFLRSYVSEPKEHTIRVERDAGKD